MSYLNPYEPPRHGRPRRTVRSFPLAIQERRTLNVGAEPGSLESLLDRWGRQRRFRIERRSAGVWVLRRNFESWELFRATFSWHIGRLPLSILVKVGARGSGRVRLYLVCRFPLSIASSGDAEWLSQELDNLEDWLTLATHRPP
jgi:hypothetical protein